MADYRELLRGVIHPWHHDHFGHMNVRHYAPFFDDATYHIWTVLGVSYRDMLETRGIHCVTAAATTTFVKELVAGDLIRVEGAVSRVGGKSVTFHLRMLHADTGEVHATYDITDVFFDPATRKATEMPDDIRAQLQAATVAPE